MSEQNTSSTGTGLLMAALALLIIGVGVYYGIDLVRNVGDTPSSTVGKGPNAGVGEQQTANGQPGQIQLTGAEATSPGTAADDPNETTPPKPPARRPLTGWEKPIAALMLSGEMHGYIEPCGCTSGQIGGLMRRATLFNEMQEKGWDVVGLDLGGLLRQDRPTR